MITRGERPLKELAGWTHHMSIQLPSYALKYGVIKLLGKVSLYNLTFLIIYIILFYFMYKIFNFVHIAYLHVFKIRL